MFGVCIEASHERGLGHFYRALNLLAYLDERKKPYVLLINDYNVAVAILCKRQIRFEVVPVARNGAGWEAGVIKRHRITTWINDRLDTDIRHAEAIKREGIRLVTFDDRGSGAGLADLHIAALHFDESVMPAGKNVVTGTRYLILNRDIERYRRLRTAVQRILVTLGGTDTYGVTVRVVAMLKKQKMGATVVIGPGFQHVRDLEGVASPPFEVKREISSLVEEFAHYDLAITGCGITAFEAAASGLPSVIVANEWFEVPNGKYLERIGCSVFAGHYSRLGDNLHIPINKLESMSRSGMEQVTTHGVENVYRELESV